MVKRLASGLTMALRRGAAGAAAEPTTMAIAAAAKARSSRGSVAGLAPARGPAALRDAWRRSRPGLAVVVLLTIFINLLKLAVPLYVFQLLDRVVASRSVETLVLLTAITVFAITAGAVAVVIRRSMLGHWGLWIEEHFGRRLFVASLARRRARSPARSLDELSTTGTFVSDGGLTAWLDVMWAPAFLLIAYLIHPWIGAVVALGMLAMILLGIAQEWATRPFRAAMRRARQRAENLRSTAEHQVDVVAGLNLTERLADRWQKSMLRRGAERRIAQVTNGTFGEGMRLVENLQRVACYGVGVWLAIDGALSVGGIIAGAVLGRIGTSAVRGAMTSWRALKLAVRSYKRLARRLQSIRPDEAAVRDPDARHALTLDQVTFVHSQWSAPIFRQLNLRVEPGQMLGIVGPSGAGKTTLTRLIAGAVPATMGAVLVGDLDIQRYGVAERRRLVGYLPQTLAFVDGTIADNIASFGTIEERDMVEAARLAGVYDIIARLPKGFETRIGPDQSPLSWGEMRRVSLARAFYRKPRLIVLDEPETNLDQALVEHIATSLQVLKDAGCVIVLASHASVLSAKADQVLVLKQRGAATLLDKPADIAAHFATATPTIPEDPAPDAGHAQLYPN